MPSKEAYIKQFVDPFAEAISNVKGLVYKIWMTDFENQYSSFYLWETKEDMDDFKNESCNNSGSYRSISNYKGCLKMDVLLY